MLNSVTPYLTLDSIAVALFVGALFAAAAHDVRAYRIPNALSISLAALYPLHVLTYPLSVHWIYAAGVAVGVLAIGIILFAQGLFGAGDAKLLAAAALWAGPTYIGELLIVTALAGGAMALVFMSPLRIPLAIAYDRFGRASANPFHAAVLPYGVAIAVGGVAVAALLMAAKV